MNFPVYVLHVKTGSEDREKSIIRQFEGLNISFEWVLQYDIPEIDATVLNRYKNPEKQLRMDEISCCLKHKTAWNKIKNSNSDGGLIFEDDVILNKIKFLSYFNIGIKEYYDLERNLGCICFGDGCAMHVPWTKIKRGKHLYISGQMRAADSYWISKQTASLLSNWIETNGFSLPADHFLTEVLNALDVPIFWLEPTIVTQGSHCGVFKSIIQLNDEGVIKKKHEFLIKKIRRKYIYPLLGIDPRYK
jgi:GR25 family glycosyltransferase involved in LPS biosynthesis